MHFFFFFFSKTSCAPHVFIVSGLIGFLLVGAFSMLISRDLSDRVLHTEGNSERNLLHKLHGAQQQLVCKENPYAQCISYISTIKDI